MYLVADRSITLPVHAQRHPFSGTRTFIRSRGNLGVTTFPLTIGVWVFISNDVYAKAPTLTIPSYPGEFLEYGGSADCIGLFHTALSFYPQSNSTVANSLRRVIFGRWVQVSAVYTSAPSRRIWVNGLPGAADTAGYTTNFAGSTAFNVGSGSMTVAAGGWVQQWGLQWPYLAADAATDNQIAAVAAGVSPARVFANLVGMWDMRSMLVGMQSNCLAGSAAGNDNATLTFQDIGTYLASRTMKKFPVVGDLPEHMSL